MDLEERKSDTRDNLWLIGQVVGQIFHCLFYNGYHNGIEAFLLEVLITSVFIFVRVLEPVEL